MFPTTIPEGEEFLPILYHLVGARKLPTLIYCVKSLLASSNFWRSKKAGKGRRNRSFSMLLQRSLERAVVNEFSRKAGTHQEPGLCCCSNNWLEERRVVRTGSCSKKAGTVVRWNGAVYGHGETGLKINKLSHVVKGLKKNKSLMNTK